MAMNLERRLNQFFFSREEMPALALCRIGFGLCILLNSIFIFPHLAEFFGVNGVFGRHYLDVVPYPSPTSFTVGSWFNILKFAESDIWANFVFVALVVASILFIVGFKTRWSGIALLVTHSMFLCLNSFAYWGWGALIISFLVYVIVSPASSDYSWAGRLPVDQRSQFVWPQRLLQIHICALYFTVAWSRVPDEVWLNGRALQLLLVSAVFGRIDSNWIEFRGILRVLTYSSWAVELAAPVLLWVPQISRTWAFLLIALHLGLEFLTGVGQWNLLLISALSTFVFQLPRATVLGPADTSGLSVHKS